MATLDVAIVDDDPVIVDLLATILRAEGFRVRSYAHPDQFLKTGGAPPDCLLLDVYMPTLSGFDVLAMIGGSHYPAPIIMISGRSDIPTAVATIEAGAYDFVEKPFEIDDLIERIRRAVCAFRMRAGGERHPGGAN